MEERAQHNDEDIAQSHTSRDENNSIPEHRGASMRDDQASTRSRTNGPVNDIGSSSVRGVL
jgi:hypothetical protein